MTNQSDKGFLLGKLGDLEALHAAIFLTLPEEVREWLLAEYMQEEKERKGGVAAGNSEDTIESLWAKLAASEEKCAASEAALAASEAKVAEAAAEISALKEENRALKVGATKGKTSRIHPE